MRDSIKVTRKQVELLARATFPAYRGRTFRVEATSEVTLFDLNWSGGSRSQYRTCTLAGEPIGSADKHNQVAPWNQTAEGQTVPVPQGAVCVRHSMFCGKDMGLTFYVHPADMPRLLTAA
jgi:hypothetical protein